MRIGLGLLFVAILLSISWVGNRILRRRGQKDNPELWRYLDTYLEMRKPGFAVFINGAWGSGKTHFIKRYIAPHNLFKMPCYLSLFGVNSRKEFDFRMWKAILSTKIKIAVLLSALLVLGLMVLGFWIRNYSLLLAIDLWSLVIPILIGALVFIWSFIHLFARDLMLRFRYLIFDDLERAEVDYSTLMAWISELVEHRCCPVIIIGNELEIIRKLNSDNRAEQSNSDKNIEGKGQAPSVDSFACEQYKRTKEKVIGKEFSLSQNDELVIRELISELPSSSPLQEILKTNTYWVVSLVLGPLHDNEIATNYRALEHVMHDFECHFSELEDFIKNKTISELLIPRYFSLMYFREVQELPEVGKFDADEILNSYMRLYKDSVPANKFFEFYPFWRDQFLTPAMWREILKGNALDTKAFSLFFENYLSPNAKPCWSQVYKLEDGKLDELVNDTKREFASSDVHYSPENILTLSKAILFFQCAVPDYSGLNGITQVILDYISREKNSDDFANYIKHHMSYPILKDDISAINMTEQPAQSDFEKIKKAVIDAVEFSYEQVRQRDFADIVDHIADKEHDFKKWYAENNLRYNDLFSGHSPQKLWGALKNIPTRLFVERMEILRGHIISVVIEKSNPEIQFWKDFIELAMATRDQWERENKNYCKQFKIKQFAEMVGSRFRSLADSEVNNGAAEARDA